MTPAYACRKDANHDSIADMFRFLGWEVEETYQHAQYTPGFPDLIVERDGRVLWVEVKIPRSGLTRQEQAFAARHAETYRVVKSVDDVLALHRNLS